ncbi:hypothetical protein WN944_019361 [Citrus x changshan-huyou]|uniref:X8 domain-containing protein n=1 Tax=Citrus x changshan-huyou TaxID=2935761 RepID=A0AAP0LY11_9ROSI
MRQSHNYKTELVSTQQDAKLLNPVTNKGTPLQPRYIEVYWLLDEDAKSTDPGNFECHWGIFRYDGQSQFAMVLLVQGQNKMLKGARGVKYRVQGQNKMLKGGRGVKYMPSQWCMLNPGAKDMSKLVDNINYACTWLDCTALGYDFSCNNLDANGNASPCRHQKLQRNIEKVRTLNMQGKKEKREDLLVARPNYKKTYMTLKKSVSSAIGMPFSEPKGS